MFQRWPSQSYATSSRGRKMPDLCLSHPSHGRRTGAKNASRLTQGRYQPIGVIGGFINRLAVPFWLLVSTNRHIGGTQRFIETRMSKRAKSLFVELRFFQWDVTRFMISF